MGEVANIPYFYWVLWIFPFALLAFINYHELTLLGIASTLYTIRWILYIFITDSWVLIAMQVTHMLTFAVLWIVAVQYVVRLLPEQFGSTGQSILAMVFMGLARIIGGSIGGWLSEEWGGASMYVFATLMSAAAASLFLGTQAFVRGKNT